jgi:hypothetical protein
MGIEKVTPDIDITKERMCCKMGIEKVTPVTPVSPSNNNNSNGNNSNNSNNGNKNSDSNAFQKALDDAKKK